MKPKEKAEELINKYYRQITYGGNIDEVNLDYVNAKECALIAVDEIINNVLVGIDLAATWGGILE
jgi:hypothetical protein